MNKKGLVIFIVGVVIIILIILFFLKSCTPRTKSEDTTNPTTEVTDDTDGTDLVVDNSLDFSKYRDPFINANTDFTCATIANPNLIKDEKMMKSKLDEAYKKYGFPIEDTDTMIQILNKYENDTEVINIIRANVQKCQTPATTPAPTPTPAPATN